MEIVGDGLMSKMEWKIGSGLRSGTYNWYHGRLD